MARTNVAPNVITTAGVAPTQTVGIADGHEFVNTGKQIVRVINADAVSRDITFVTGGTASGEPIADRTVSVPAGAVRYVGPFPTGAWNPGDKKVDIDYEVGEHDHFTIEIIDTTL